MVDARKIEISEELRGRKLEAMRLRVAYSRLKASNASATAASEIDAKGALLDASVAKLELECQALESQKAALSERFEADLQAADKRRALAAWRLEGERGAGKREAELQRVGGLDALGWEARLRVRAGPISHRRRRRRRKRRRRWRWRRRGGDRS